ncbi:MAG: UDP-N-acetylmuramoyl-L-alanyl-D-glutamate--2,6-diaminopimelate ligase [candidate division Zixibacteria bacterium]|nr:UDP-N-acetylmuramoyl-L-alanyl-D-glutamate--2,6-diaminopimelate ligase [candidate division Zixibacteria bacterium]
MSVTMVEKEVKTAERLFAGTGVLLPNHAPEILIEGVTCDSRKVKAGDLFFALPGFHTDGAKFIANAVESGAVLVVAERHVDCDVPLIECAPARRVLAEVSSNFYGNPSADLRVIGITGTNGKTTVCGMVKSIFEATGIKTAQFGTLGYVTGEKFENPVNTTPESKELQRLMRESVDNGCKAVVFEVSSHALAMYRVHAVDFDMGVFTNLTSEHLDFHKDIENYFMTKRQLFEDLRSKNRTAIINIADPYGRRICGIEGLDVFSYGDDGGAEIYTIENNILPRYSDVTIGTPRGPITMKINIPGRFNIDNVMAAVAVGIKCGIKRDSIREGLESFKSPAGRMQNLDFGQPYNIIIDFAHTPDALMKMLFSVKEFTKGRVITLFGCGGNKDGTKRAPMAQAVAGFSDKVILTSDNPRSENPETIMDEVERGFPPGFDFRRISKRDEAIRYALELAGDDDTVVLAGKGHENYQIYGDEALYFSEEEIVRDFLKKERKN